MENVFRNDTLISTYVYDENGNRLSHTTPEGTTYGTYDDQDRMLTYGDASFGYTPNGSLKFKVEGLDTTWYNYDNIGNLISVLMPDGNFIEYLIDEQNRRIGKNVNEQVVKRWIYNDQLNPVAELDADGNVITRFVYGSKGHVPDYMIKGDSTYSFITDHLGSVRLVVNVETGYVAQRLAYDEFGNVLLNTNFAFQPFSYAGGLFYTHTGLVRFGFRDYSPMLGRWTSKDPREIGRICNLYSYCNNSPISYIDISGDLPFSPYNQLFEYYVNKFIDTIVNAVTSVAPDAFVASIAITGVAGGGPEIGFDFVKIFNKKGWNVYFAPGGGVGRSVGINILFGFTWNVECPGDYEGKMNEIQANFEKLGLSVTWWQEGPTTFMLGVSFGEPLGLAYLLKYYVPL